jgi:hypothetical protein
MKLRLHHALWTHLPAVLLLGATFVRLLWRPEPLPRDIPFPLGWGRQPLPPGWTTWDLAIYPAGALVPLVLSLVADELWARQETGKRYNVLALLDEFAVGLFVGPVWGYLGAASSGEVSLFLTVGVPLIAVSLAIGAAALLELARPFRLSEREAVVAEDTAVLEAELAERVRSGQRWVYWETQAPAWLSVFALLMALFLVAAVVALGFRPLFNSVWELLMALVMLLMAAFVFGMRVTVTPEEVVVRLGLLGRRAATIPVARLAEADVCSFSPFPDFRGFYQAGFRYRGLRAFFFRGNRGVKLATASGERYLLGSDHPERLLTAIKAAMASQPQAPAVVAIQS